jgi:peptidyl-prolyl cis-trans isomerase D
MFDFIRTHKKIMQILLIILIFPSFVLFGIDGYKRFNEAGETVAVVDGLKISKEEWEQSHKNEVERMRTSMPNIDVGMFDTPAMKFGVLDRMVQAKVLESSAKQLHLFASDQKLALTISEMEALAALKKSDGSLDIDRYKQLLAAQGMTPDMFEAKIRNDLAVRQVVNGVTQSSITFPTQVEVAMNAFTQQREIQVAIFSASDYMGQAKPTDEELNAFYTKHKDRYKSIESADIEYVVLNLEAVEKTITVNETDLKTYFEQNQANLASKEERRASHILINAGKDMNAADRQKAKEKALSISEALKKKPDQFSELAKKNSEDSGSAGKGGDLDFFAKGSMVKAFEDAAFGMKKGEISGLVETEFGFHIIQLTDIKSAATQDFQKIKPQLEAELKKDLAKKKFAELAEQFSNLTYEQSDSLKPVATKLKLDILTAKGVSRESKESAQMPWAHPNIIKAIFASDSIDKKRNTEAVETAPNQLTAGRITAYRPAVVIPLEEVRSVVVQALLAEKSIELAKAEGKEKLKSWLEKPETAQWQVPVLISREQSQQLPANLVELAMRADASKLPFVGGVDLGARGFGIVKVAKVLPPSEQKPRPESLERFTKSWATAENLAYFSLLKDRLKVSVKVAPPTDNRLVK